MSAAMKNATVIQFSIQRLQCSACGAEANASCNCGQPYVPAMERAKREAEKDPSASVRTIAERARTGVRQAHEAKKAVSKETPEQAVPDGTPKTVTGRDGKQYPARREKVTEKLTVEDELEADEYREAFLLRAADAVVFAVYSGQVDSEVIAAAKRVAATWSEFVQTLEAIEAEAYGGHELSPHVQVVK
jgi:hypothetical protein